MREEKGEVWKDGRGQYIYSYIYVKRGKRERRGMEKLKIERGEARYRGAGKTKLQKRQEEGKNRKKINVINLLLSLAKSG